MGFLYFIVLKHFNYKKKLEKKKNRKNYVQQ